MNKPNITPERIADQRARCLEYGMTGTTRNEIFLAVLDKIEGLQKDNENLETRIREIHKWWDEK